MPPLLLTPGPLTTSDQTRAALCRDWGSRESDFIALSEGVRARLAALAGVEGTHVAVPVQGSGTFAVEAAIQTLVPPDGRLLVLVNGAYGRRVVEIARRLGRACVTLEAPEDQPILPGRVAGALAADSTISDVVLIHCETTSGLLNPLPEIAACVRQAGRRMLVDAMSSFGAMPIDGAKIPFTALIGSSNKGLEGVPGLGFVIVETDYLRGCAHNSSSLSLDLFDQWRGFKSNGQWRFTPPVQVVAGLGAALDQLQTEGGIAVRHARYRRNCDVLVQGMRARGFTTYIESDLQAPVIVTFRIPAGDWFHFQTFYDFLHARDIVIYPGKLTHEPSFRIGCIGAIGADDMMRALAAIDAFLAAHRTVQSAA
jgi:2-aminoethylphosphonate-pyruvate transaminase